MTRLRIALVSLAVALSLSAPAAVRPAEVNAATEDVATVFSFDFSGSIFCFNGDERYSPCTPINMDLSNAVGALATQIENSSQTYADRALTFKVAVYGGEGTLKVIDSNGQRCAGNTKENVNLLVSCLQTISSLYRESSNRLGATFYAQNFDVVNFGTGVRCGLILFTDGQPDDKAKAEKASRGTSCAVLPVATGVEIKPNTERWLKDTFTQGDLEPIANCTNAISWEKVYFKNADEAADAIARALEEIACLASIPSYACATVDEIVQILREAKLIVTIGPGVIGTEYPIGIKKPGKTVPRGEELKITSSTPERPASCPEEPVPTPTPTPNIPPITDLPCIATFPSMQWLGCNLWVLALLALAIILRLVWIGLDLQVSVNGKPNVGLRGGRVIGFNIQDAGIGAAATRTPNPTIAQVKVSRAFFRFLPGTVIDRTALNLGPTTKGNRFRFSLGEKVELKPGVVAVFSYGNPSRKPSVSPIVGSRVSSPEQKPRNKALQ